MCDQHCCHKIIQRRNFHCTYMKQHSRMTAWLQQTHWRLNNSNTPHHCKLNESQPVSSSSWHLHQRRYSSTPINPQQSVHHRSSIPINPGQPVHQRASSIPINPEHPNLIPVAEEHCIFNSSEPISEESCESENDESMDEEEELEVSESDSSEDEIEFNADAIFAFRQSKEASEESEVDSFVKLDPDSCEEFEYVELGSFKTLRSRRAVFKDSTEIEQEQDEKQVMKFLYGDEASTIGGLEACMNVNFNRWYDVLQPVLWPVLPLKL